MIGLFDDIPRVYLGPAKHGERDFEYVNRSGRVGIQEVRDLLDTWWRDFPKSGRTSIRGRVRSGSDVDFAGAIFELAVFKTFLRVGCNLLELEPSVANGRAPDFLFATPNGDPFYVEAVVSWDQSDEQRTAETRLEEAVQALDEVNSPAYHLSLQTSGHPTNSVPRREMRDSLQAWVNGLNDNEARNEKHWKFGAFGANFEISVFAPRKAVRDGRAISVRHFEPYSGAPHESLRSSLIYKAKRYGNLPHPFVISVNAKNDLLDDSDLISALYGTESVSIPVFENSIGEPRLERLADGLWRGADGPRRRGVSAILYYEKFSAWRASRSNPVFAINPWASKPLAESFGLSSSRVENDTVVFEEGKSASQLFDLPVDWPTSD